MCFDDQPRTNYFSFSENRHFFHNAFSVFDKDLIEEYPFNEEVSGKEDRVWAKELMMESEHDYHYIPSMVCHHHYTPNGATWKYSEELRERISNENPRRDIS